MGGVRHGRTFECDGCKAVQHVDPREFSPYRTEESLLEYYYHWQIVPNPPNEKGMDRHYCPNCKASRRD